VVSVLANEPMLFAAAKSYPPALVAAAGTIGCLVAIVLDYALIGWLVNQRLIRRELDESTWYRWSQKVFGRAPFLLILGSALFPVPFYPVKILAIATDYPVWRFVLALVLGRLPRFYLLACVGGRRARAHRWLGRLAHLPAQSPGSRSTPGIELLNASRGRKNGACQSLTQVLQTTRLIPVTFESR
jgi:membrane protein YqaA with SNARE-associated domain